MSPRKIPDARRLTRLLLPLMVLGLLARGSRAAESWPSPHAGPEQVETFSVHESFRTIWVDTHAPYSPEISNETQSRELAKEAATVVGQNAILQHILKKRTSKGKTLEEARIPSTDIQNRVAALIKGAEVSRVRFDKDGCRLRVSVDKANLKVILRKA